MSILIAKGEIIGSCSHSICHCVSNNREPQGCLAFIPKGNERMAYNTVNDILAEWMHARGISGSPPPELVRRIVGAVVGGGDDSNEKAIGPAVKPDPDGIAGDHYCVVAIEGINRVWHDTVHAAVRHAQHLFEGRDPNGTRSTTKAKRLMIVKATRLVERQPPALPPVIVRTPINRDFPVLTSGRHIDPFKDDGSDD